jgi:hypothetical protein
MYSRLCSRPARILLAALLLVVVPDAARALCTNLLWNPGFDLGTTGWNTSASGAGVDVYLVAAPDDRLGDPGEYAGLVTNTSAGAGTDVGTFPLEANTCIGVGAGAQVQVAGWVWIPQPQSATGFASISLRWSDLAHCAGTLDFAPTSSVSTPGNWTFVDDLVTAPPGVDSFAIGLQVTKNPAGGTFMVYYDDLSICVPEPRSGLCAGAAAAALAALSVCRERSRDRTHRDRA